MLDSYLFIPGDKDKFLNKMSDLQPDYFVVDLEDAVSQSQKKVALNKVLSRDFEPNTFFRIPFMEGIYSREEMLKLALKTQGKVVIPKVRTLNDLEYVLSILKSLKQIQLIVLVENPECLLNLKDILSGVGKHIYALGFGSHDFCSETGIKHETEFINPIKMQFNLIVKAFGIQVLDGVDVNIRKTQGLIKECQYAFDLGMDGKFYIHPAQVDVANQINYLTPQEKQTYKKVYDKLQSLDKKEVDILEVDGRIYEKPHIHRILKLMEKLK